MAKKCKSCFEEKDSEEFYKGKSRCKDCVIGASAVTKGLVKAYKWVVKARSTCVDCGERNPMVLDFDHIDGADKKNSVARIYTSIKAVREEMKKCEVRCANCHRVKTARTHNWYEDMLDLDSLWLRTYLGGSFEPFNPKPVSIEIEDIAHSLSMQCRWNGHIDEFYSVAQHCLLTSYLVDDKYMLEALMHDATEAYIGDVPSPVKAGLPEYIHTEDKIWKAIARKFKMREVLPKEIKDADVYMMKLEKKVLVRDYEDGFHDDVENLKIRLDIKPMGPKMAKQQFMERFHELTKKRKK